MIVYISEQQSTIWMFQGEQMLNELNTADMKRTAVLFISDEGFIIPTAGAALSARANISDPSVVVQIVLLDVRPGILAQLRDVLEPLGVRLTTANQKDIIEIDPERFPQSVHVPISSMVRLKADRLLDENISRFLYLDGDIDIVGSLDPLLSQAIPSRGFLAGADSPLVLEGERGARAATMKKYLNDLGISSGRHYFNSGVLLVDRAGWRDIGDAAQAFFLKHPERCRWHDQSALNAVAGDMRGVLSPCWNYVSEFMANLDPRKHGFHPTIWHFTGFPKPWHSTSTPWDSGFGRSIQIGTDLLAPLGLSLRRPSRESIERGEQHYQRVLQRNRWIFFWRETLRARRILSALALGSAKPNDIYLDRSKA